MSEWIKAIYEVSLYPYIIVIILIIGILIYTFTSTNKIKQSQSFNSFIKKALAIEVILIALLGVLAYGICKNNLAYMDKIVNSWVILMKSDFMTKFMLAMSFFGSSYFLPFVFLFSYYMLVFKLRKPRTGLILLINILGANFIKMIIKIIFKRPRPEYAMFIVNEYSFPSGHSFVGFTFYAMLAYIIYKYYNGPWKHLITVFLVIFPIIIAFSRLYLGVHYASDVFAGLLLGTFWLVFCITLDKWV